MSIERQSLFVELSSSAAHVVENRNCEVRSLTPTAISVLSFRTPDSHATFLAVVSTPIHTLALPAAPLPDLEPCPALTREARPQPTLTPVLIFNWNLSPKIATHSPELGPSLGFNSSSQSFDLNPDPDLTQSCIFVGRSGTLQARNRIGERVGLKIRNVA